MESILHKSEPGVSDCVADSLCDLGKGTHVS